jgi:hypothetical protein
MTTGKSWRDAISLWCEVFSSSPTFRYPFPTWEWSSKVFGLPNKEALYTTLLMSPGLSIGTISSLFGLSHKIIDHFVATIIASAVIPMVVANAFYLPHHLLPAPETG